MKTYWEQVKDAQDKALSKKVKVGALCIGFDWKTMKRKAFAGSNIHVSDSFADVHAEQLAVTLSLLERHYPLEIHVTSKSKKELITLCGSCRHFISEVNRLCTIIVHNPDGSIKIQKFLSEIYPYRKNTVSKNNKFKRLCGYKK